MDKFYQGFMFEIRKAGAFGIMGTSQVAKNIVPPLRSVGLRFAEATKKMVVRGNRGSAAYISPIPK